MKLGKIEFKNQLPNPKNLGPANLLIYDSYFDKNNESSETIQNWLKKFPYRISFPAGEELKNLSEFPEKMIRILDLVSQLSVKNVQIVSFGGGSIGDFSGFVASILKRGLPLVHIPTTWLSAMDSSHGGKTALNVAGYKNQIGTFYGADKIILVKEVLFHQPEARSHEAFGEALKMALLSGGSLWTKFSQIKKFDNLIAWKFLPELINGKYKIVKKDPFEKKGYRHALNLGHTFGHVWEASQNLPHGIAVLYGLRAALEFSKQENIISKKDYDKLLLSPVMSLLPSRKNLSQIAAKSDGAEKHLLQDKKISSKKALRFIFIQRPGRCPIKDVSIEKLIAFNSFLQNEFQT